MRISAVSRNEVIERKGQLLLQSKGAANAFIECLKAVYRTAINNEWCEKSPVANVALESYDSRERFLQPEEMARFMAALEQIKPSIKSLILVGLFTGARRTNVCEMRWDQINLDAATWTIPKSKFKTNKTTVLALAPEVVSILRTRAAFSASEWVFPGRTTARPIQNIKRQWKRLLEAAKIDDLEFHDLRRTLGSWQVNAGVPLEIIGKSLGHGKSESTEVYARLQLSTIRKAVESVVKAMTRASGDVS